MSEDGQRPRVVLMCGLCCSGKTRYARRLEQQGYVRISADKGAWRHAGGDPAHLSHEMRMKIFRRVFAELTDNLRSLVEQGRDVVVDSTLCKRAKRDEMRDICRGLGVSHKLVYCCAPEAEIRRRAALRSGIGPDDLIIDGDDLNSYIRNFEAPGADEVATLVLPEN